MKLAAAIALASMLSGCASAGLSPFERTQEFGYAPAALPLPPEPAATAAMAMGPPIPSPQPAASDVGPAGPVVRGAAPSDERAGVYDERDDPYMMAMEIEGEPADTPRFPFAENGGSRDLPPSPRFEIIDLRDIGSAVEASIR